MSPFGEMKLMFQGSVTLLRTNHHQSVKNGNCSKSPTGDRNNS